MAASSAWRSASESSCHPRSGLGDDVVNYSLQVAGLLVNRKLPVGARPFLEDLKRVLHFLAAAQVVDHVADEPLDHLADQFAGRELLLLAEVEQLAVQAEAHRPPLV